MDFKGKATIPTTRKNIEFPKPSHTYQPLELLRSTEAALRRPTVATLISILPPKLSHKLQVASTVADESLQELAEINIEEISDFELRPVRIYVGLSFVGFGGLMILVLLLYLNSLHPALNTIAQIRQYWYEYVWCVSLGVTGMFILGREAMRPNFRSKKFKKR
ncbi:hypothetical protein [Umezakia ovalisporum]|jgi:hypothetical protein|uniref:Uncharacterized protein n=2 Tax=Umezakia ovalisporum TaxID=75695 RepID=A0AA43GZM9_9CYAN|nr:hypothetical protein [Umezakia ovalisporum]MBI1241882.1 hypothetical protein [Nostoc sp. RI_552]MDH6055442.1 hypothetical protein [Umezakia ovalisporum FSS-43]MDH6064142.1 hypothetical protein [Umezakia ovalisporum FSS-62]MDH6068485.1 hypothetical protein [Umezakia ovalisporum APH033B]MDH6069984.1 hypothetical protein [Umezakia ovalisporum CobakiLakeA]